MGIIVCGQCRGICSKAIIVNDERLRLCEQCWHNEKMREKDERYERYKNRQR